MGREQGWTVEAVYSDEAASAWSGDRGPQLARAMEHAERIAPCVLVVQHSDRLARGDGKQARHLVEIVTWAIGADVTIRSVQDDLFADQRTQVLMGALMGMRNTEDSTRKSEAVKSGMKRRAEAGRFSGPRPYGYEYEKRNDDSYLVICEAEAVIVARIYDEFVGGRSISKIARGLHRDRIPTQRGKYWRQSTVSGILANPVYIGKMTFRGETVEAIHEPVIDEGLWERAAMLLASRKSRGRGRPTNGLHLFRAGMLRCGECGESMVPRTADWEYYYCNGHSKLGPDHCSMGKAIRRVDVDDAVYRYFEQVGIDLEATRQSVSEARDRRLAEIRALRAEAEKEADRADERLARVRRDYTDGKLDAEDWAGFKKDLGAELEAARAEVTRLLASEEEVETETARGNAETEMLRRLTEIRKTIAGEIQSAESVEAVRAALTRLFESFVLHRTTPGRVHVELVGETWIEPIPRESAIEGYSETMTPILRREPLSQAENKQRIPSPSR